MAEYEEEMESRSVLPWLIGGLTIGAVVGILFAPKGGSEIREDLSDYWDRARSRGGFLNRVKEKIPARVKAAAGLGAMKGAAKEAYRETKERFNA